MSSYPNKGGVGGGSGGGGGRDTFLDEHGPLTTIDSLNESEYYGDDDAHSSSSKGDSTTGKGGNNGTNGGGNGPAKLTQREDQLISRSKLVVGIVLLVATALVAGMTHRYTKAEELNDFETRFIDFANQIISVHQINANNIINTYESFALQLTTYAVGVQATWPFVTIPEYAAIAHRAMNQTGSSVLSLVPLVTRDQHDEWGDYSVRHSYWIQENIYYEQVMKINLFSNNSASAAGGFGGGGGGSGPPPGVMAAGGTSSGIPSDVSAATTTRQSGTPPPGVVITGGDYSGGEGGGGPPAGIFTDGADSSSSAAAEGGSGNGGPPEGIFDGSYDWSSNNMEILPFIYGGFPSYPGEETQPLREPQFNGKYYAPLWQTAANDGTPVGILTNYDSYGFEAFPDIFDRMIRYQTPILSQAFPLVASQAIPQSYMVVPVYKTVLPDENTGTRDVAAALISILPWENYFVDLVPEGIDGIYLIIKNSCDGIDDYSYEINGPEVTFLGVGDFHDTDYDDFEVTTDFSTYAVTECVNTLHIYPSTTFQDAYVTNRPIVYPVAAIAIFFITALVFVVYDCLVEHRQDKVLTTATRTTAIVSSLFPATVRDRLMDDAAAAEQAPPKSFRQKAMMSDTTIKNQILPFGGGADSNAWKTDVVQKELSQQKSPTGGPSSNRSLNLSSSKPIADLFPSASVMFADISGFTAWSSVREPTQVFTLLEGIYNSFDRVAKRRGVFKVETIGDCYVAACGLPERREKHAVILARFSRDCVKKMKDVVQVLETQLGPDTGDLGIRVGIHSGPVTAGVLRGEKSRFQLFGDTVNTAARMESTGLKNRIQLSQQTADLINASSCKDVWVKPRETLIEAKGKGTLQTYWLEYAAAGSGSLLSSIHDTSLLSEDPEALIPRCTPEDMAAAKSEKMERLIDWNVDVLQSLLQKIVAMRGLDTKSAHNLKTKNLKKGHTVLDEVKDIITLPSQPAKQVVQPGSIELSPLVITQLRSYVSVIASMYRDHRFHCFEHASHVTQSVTKLLSRVVSPDVIDYGDLAYKQKAASKDLHEYTYGITSDPIAQFAVAFAALIHDVDHKGVPNSQLIKENSDEAKIYKNKSVAEQHSVDISWELLMDGEYKDLCACIFTTQDELDRFRQVVVNTVMATDIVDKELGALRRKRWEAAFIRKSGSSKDLVATQSDTMEDANRKATIVIEHLIQASDVSHTMQHWHVYLKWNERFFHECYQAFVDGRAEKDPSIGWYEGELGFYDYYIIPLAKKLKECKVFGVSSDEYLDYAEANRAEWALKGKDLVTGYRRTFNEFKANAAKTAAATTTTTTKKKVIKKTKK